VFLSCYLPVGSPQPPARHARRRGGRGGAAAQHVVERSLLQPTVLLSLQWIRQSMTSISASGASGHLALSAIMLMSSAAAAAAPSAALPCRRHQMLTHTCRPNHHAAASAILPWEATGVKINAALVQHVAIYHWSATIAFSRYANCGRRDHGHGIHQCVQ
jgi:hypothetical protein